MKNTIKKQRGFATLLVSLMILMLISLNVFIGAKGSVIEQKSSNNQYRTEEAFQNAEAGVAKLIENIKAYIAANPTTTDFSSVITATSLDRFSATFNTANSTITSLGVGSGNSTRTVTQRIKLTGSGGSGVAALNALGSVTLAGSASATSVKAGSFVPPNMTGGNSSEFKVILLDHNNKTLMDGGNAVQRSMTTDEYFMYFFSGLCPAAKALNTPAACKAEAKTKIIADTVKGYYCSTDCGSKSDSDLTTAYDTGKRIFWLEGGLNHKLILGTVADPVIVLVMNVVDGGSAVHINSKSTLNGVLYIDILDGKTTTSCSCTATATATSIARVVVDYLHPSSYTLKNGTMTCGAGVAGWELVSNNKCTYGVKDEHGNVLQMVITNNNDKLKVVDTVVYPSIYAASWNLANIGLNSNQDRSCTVNACTAAATKCTPEATASTSIGATGQCSYSANAVSGSNDTQVQIEVVGTWDNSGGGNTLINGAAITSGNFTGQGDIGFIKSSSTITNAVLSGATGAGFNSSPASVIIVSNGWNDAN